MTIVVLDLATSHFVCSCAMVIDAYKEHGFDGLSRLFGADKNGKIRVTNNRKVKNKICDYLRTKY